MNPAFARQLVEAAQSLGAQQSETFWARSRSTRVEYGNNRFQTAATAEAAGLGLRVIAAGRLGFVSTCRPQRPAELAQLALETAEHGDQIEPGFEFAGPRRGGSIVEPYDEAVASLRPQAMRDMARGAISRLGNQSAVLAGAQIASQVTEVGLVTSNGFEASYRR